MKTLFVTFTLLLLSVFTHAQRQAVSTQSEWQLLLNTAKTYAQTGQVSPQLMERFPIAKIKGGYYVSLFGITHSGANWSFLQAEGALKGSQNGNIATVKVPLEKLHQLDFSDVYSYLEIPGKAAPHLDRAVKDTRADSVQYGWGLPDAFTGQEVLIGITDWGFDYTHPMFYDTLLAQTRIHAAWDQFKLSGNAPAAYGYGAEYVNDAELLAAGSDTANIYSFATHGSHVAGIAGGSGGGLNQYRGFAFESEFLFATFLIDAASVIDAFNWMKTKADAAGKRLVINMSWGLYYMGTLDGNSLLSQAIGQLADQGVVFVSSAGNNGSVNFHIKKTFANDSFSSRVDFYDYAANPNMWGQSITAWGEQGNDFAAGIRVYNTSGVELTASPLYSTTMNGYLDSMLVTGNDTIWFNVAAEYSHPLNSRPTMRLRVKNTNTSLKVVLKSAATAGTVHYWNVTELVTGVGNWGMPLVTFGVTDGLSGDAQYSIGEPTCSPNVISVGAYQSQYSTPSGNSAGGAIASFTSIGPVYTEAMKPDISAPGVSVVSSISSFTDNAYTQAATTNFNGTDYDFARFSGTSMASPCVAGIVALMLDASPTLSPVQVKDILKATARQDQFTGVITAPGHTRWGMGKVNAYAAVILALNTVSLEEFATNNWLIVYPNPATENSVTLLLPENESIQSVAVYTTDGKAVAVTRENAVLDISTLPSGTYLVRVTGTSGVLSTTFVK